MKYLIYNNNSDSVVCNTFFDELEAAKAYAEAECEEDSDLTIYQATPVTQGTAQQKPSWICLIDKALK